MEGRTQQRGMDVGRGGNGAGTGERACGYSCGGAQRHAGCARPAAAASGTHRCGPGADQAGQAPAAGVADNLRRPGGQAGQLGFDWRFGGCRETKQARRSARAAHLLHRVGRAGQGLGAQVKAAHVGVARGGCGRRGRQAGALRQRAAAFAIAPGFGGGGRVAQLAPPSRRRPARRAAGGARRGQGGSRSPGATGGTSQSPVISNTCWLIQGKTSPTSVNTSGGGGGPAGRRGQGR